jgi:hypothetical protein
MIVKAIKNTKLLIKDLEYEVICIKYYRTNSANYYYVKIKNIEKELSINNFRLLNGDKLPTETYFSPNYNEEDLDTKILYEEDLKNGVRYVGKNKKIPKDVIYKPESVKYRHNFGQPIISKIKIKCHNRFLSPYGNFEKVTPKFMKEVRANKMNSVLNKLNDESAEKLLEEKKENKRQLKLLNKKKELLLDAAKGIEYIINIDNYANLKNTLEKSLSEYNLKDKEKIFELFNI